MSRVSRASAFTGVLFSGESRLLTRKRITFFSVVILITAWVCTSAGQAPPGLMETGHIAAAGKQVPYRIRHLPVNAFPEIPGPIAIALTSRGCLIPQTYGAHGPENVIHGSFEEAGSTDWALLCSSRGNVSLLVFLASGSPSAPAVLATVAETSRLQQGDTVGDFGFDWGIDAATPKQIHEGRAGKLKQLPTPNHDCIADSVVDHPPAYRCLQAGKWITLDSQ